MHNTKQNIYLCIINNTEHKMKKLFFILLLLTASIVKSNAMGLPNSIYIQKSIAKGDVTKQDLRVSIKENMSSKTEKKSLTAHKIQVKSNFSIFEKFFIFIGSLVGLHV